MIYFFKGILILLINVGLGYIFFFPLKFFLFLPREKKYFLGKHIPFTPGYIPRKKKWFYERIKKELHEYLDDALHPSRKKSRISKWESDFYKKVWDHIDFSEKYTYVPEFIRLRVQTFIATLMYEIVKQFLRNFVPWMLEKYTVEFRIDQVNEKVEMELLETYFHKYFYRFIQWPALIIGFLCGLTNMILFWILL